MAFQSHSVEYYDTVGGGADSMVRSPWYPQNPNYEPYYRHGYGNVPQPQSGGPRTRGQLCCPCPDVRYNHPCTACGQLAPSWPEYQRMRTGICARHTRAEAQPTPPFQQARCNGKDCCSNNHFSDAYEAHMIAENRSRRVRVEGKLVDMRCYSIALENDGDNHLAPPSPQKTKIGCGAACLANGVPAGVLVGGVPGNKVYVLLTPAPQLSAYIAKRVRVEGRLMTDSNAILTTNIEVFNAATGQYECVKTVTPM